MFMGFPMFWQLQLRFFENFYMFWPPEETIFAEVAATGSFVALALGWLLSAEPSTVDLSALVFSVDTGLFTAGEVALIASLPLVVVFIKTIAALPKTVDATNKVQAESSLLRMTH